MDKVFEERVKNLKVITDRHVFREIEGCTSWRHFVVHQDRAWLLNAIGKIQNQVEKVRLAASESGKEQAIGTEINELLAMFEETRLNHLGDEDK
jgi:hypothetical protein